MVISQNQMALLMKAGELEFLTNELQESLLIRDDKTDKKNSDVAAELEGWIKWIEKMKIQNKKSVRMLCKLISKYGLTPDKAVNFERHLQQRGAEKLRMDKFFFGVVADKRDLLVLK